MKHVYTYFMNHCDLVWRRCWDRDYLYMGGRYASYRRIEELCIERNIGLAEQGEGAYVVEQAFTMRAYLETHPEALPRVKALYDKGLFEMLGAGEAIIDVNMCAGETMCRNMASGVRYCRDVLGMPPLMANHNDGFGSSAQFPQVMRGCGFNATQKLSYSEPEKEYWRGLDGSTVYVWRERPGVLNFYDHCYHEPCRVCRNLEPAGCEACEGTGLDLPQNSYPPFEPVPDDGFEQELAVYVVCSEEMLPPRDFSRYLADWQTEDVRYTWGTLRHIAPVWQAKADAADNPPAEALSPGVENNPVQTGCLVSRIKVKQLARRLESAYFGWEQAMMLTPGAAARLDRQRWETLFLELPLAFFHDSVTGTHNDEAYLELLDRMQGCLAGIATEAERVFEAPADAGDGEVAVFRPHASETHADLPPVDWREVKPQVAVDDAGNRFPVVYPIHPVAPAVPLVTGRLVNAVGADARTRPEATTPRIELPAADPWRWQTLRLEDAADPEPLPERTLRNDHLEVDLGDDGVSEVRDLASGQSIAADTWTIGELILEEDEGDPWGTRKPCSFRQGMRAFTRFLGGARFDGYQEAWYYGRFEPNLRFGREEDPKIFSLEWMTTVRLLDQARRLDIGLEVFWKSSDRRVRVAFPLQAPSDEGYYSIPAGWLKRPRYEQEETCLWSPNGDWPALHAVATEARDGVGWAVVNHGTPSARVEDGAVLMSVLRSPGFGHCLERYAQTYPMPTSGIRDGGWHHFEFNLMPYREGDVPAVMQTASELNQTAPVLPGKAPESGSWALAGEAIHLLAAKPCFDATQTESTILRLVNLSPDEQGAVLQVPAGAKAYSCNLLEEPGEEVEVDHGRLALHFQPFEIRSVVISA